MEFEVFFEESDGAFAILLVLLLPGEHQNDVWVRGIEVRRLGEGARGFGVPSTHIFLDGLFDEAIGLAGIEASDDLPLLGRLGDKALMVERIRQESSSLDVRRVVFQEMQIMTARFLVTLFFR